MSGWMSYFGGRKDPKATARDAIVTLRQQLQMLEKKEDYLQKKIDEELKKAKDNAISNKSAATAALRRKKQYETELERLNGTRLTLETQVHAIESANINANTMDAMRQGAEALRIIHGDTTIERVDATMDSIREQMELTNEISGLISDPMNLGIENNDEELKAQLAELEAEKLDEVLGRVERVPQHVPSVPTAETSKQREQESEEDRELRELQASLAM